MLPGITDGLSAMRLEIEETQLLRRLVFQNDTGNTIGIEVVSGRALRVAEPVTHQLPAGCADLIGQDLLEDHHDQISAVIDMFRDFCAGTETLRVESHILAEKKEASSVGIPGSKLCEPFRDLAKTPEILSGQNDLSVFAERCASSATAILGFEGDAISFELGPDEFLKPLRDVADAEQAKASEKPGTERSKKSEPSCIILSEHPANGRSLLRATASGSQIFVLFDTTALTKFLTFWTESRV